ncbi:hypothetical protein KIW84_044396 [Lathyrus oleraceus]|uniref:Uncharacterized protein n=1 Tax=Pisum sativum TaxID=3888 RepID=A0A9D4XID2_PEA|nr:hypothetical protein KIW84_044396 [Pisum sativum]
MDQQEVNFWSPQQSRQLSHYAKNRRENETTEPPPCVIYPKRGKANARSKPGKDMVSRPKRMGSGVGYAKGRFEGICNCHVNLHSSTVPIQHEFSNVLLQFNSTMPADEGSNLRCYTHLLDDETEGDTSGQARGQAWGWSRMSSLAPINERPFVFPFATKWSVRGMNYNRCLKHAIVVYRNLLDHIGHDDRPYLGLDHDVNHDDAAVWTTKTPVIRFTMVEMHQSDRVKLQF